MNSLTKRGKWLTFWMTLLLAAPVMPLRVIAQDEAPAARGEEEGKATESKQTESKEPDSKETESKPRTKSRGRLPMYYSRVVNSEQREKIYEIQAKFDKQIAELMDEIKSLQKQRDDQVHGVLTAEQQKEVDDLVAEARKQRQALKNAKDKGDSEEATIAETGEGQ